MLHEVKLFMYERYQLYNTKLVDIRETNNNTYLRILDDQGRMLIFQIKEMLVMDCLTETDHTNKEYQSVIYRGKIEKARQGIIEDQIYFFKYIPNKKEWYICGDVSRLLENDKERNSR